MTGHDTTISGPLTDTLRGAVHRIADQRLAKAFRSSMAGDPDAKWRVDGRRCSAPVADWHPNEAEALRVYLNHRIAVRQAAIVDLVDKLAIERDALRNLSGIMGELEQAVEAADRLEGESSAEARAKRENGGKR